LSSLGSKISHQLKKGQSVVGSNAIKKL